MASESRFPNVPKDLLEALKAAFPNTLPDREDVTIERVRLLQGQQQVISLLSRHYDKQTKNILEN